MTVGRFVQAGSMAEKHRSICGVGQRGRCRWRGGGRGVVRDGRGVEEGGHSEGGRGGREDIGSWG